MFAKHYIIEQMAGIDVSNLIDYTSWNADAQTLFYEGRGISALFDEQRTVRDWLEQIDQHIFGGIRYGVDGKFESKLLRGSETLSSMVSLNAEDHCLEPPEFSRPTWLGVINELKIQHPLRTFEETCTPEECMIVGSSHQLDFGESINLEAICSSGDPDKCNFSWGVSDGDGSGSGGGSLSTSIGGTTTFTAPLSNYACKPVQISLFGNGKLVYTWTSITTDADNGKVAYLQCDAGETSCTPYWGIWPEDMECPDNKCCCWCHYHGYDCAGTIVPTYSHGWPAGYRIGGGSATICAANDPPGSANCPGGDCSSWVGDIIDWRGVCGSECADLNVSCCPEDLVLGL